MKTLLVVCEFSKERHRWGAFANRQIASVRKPKASTASCPSQSDEHVERACTVLSDVRQGMVLGKYVPTHLGRMSFVSQRTCKVDFAMQSSDSQPLEHFTNGRPALQRVSPPSGRKNSRFPPDGHIGHLEGWHPHWQKASQ